MENKKYQIFISSTFTDLQEERNKVIQTILSLGHFPIGMEMFGADTDEQWEIIKETIDTSDYYLIIVGHRYGTLAADGKSYTEKEFDYAIERGVPVFAFIQSRDVATAPFKRDSDSSLSQNLTNFIAKVTHGRICNFWINTNELCQVVALALPKAIRRTPREGWVKASEASTPEVANELAKLSLENRELRRELEHLRSISVDSYPEFDFFN